MKPVAMLGKLFHPNRQPRPPVLEPDAQALDVLAQRQLIADPEVAHCWGLIREAIQTSCVGTQNLDRLISHLRAGNGMGFNEISIEVREADPGRILVALLKDERHCPAPAMIFELERLRESAQSACRSTQ